MTTWILIILVYAGATSDSDSVALTNVTGFTTQESCQQAGKLSTALTNRTKKNTRFVCVPQPKGGFQ